MFSTATWQNLVDYLALALKLSTVHIWPTSFAENTAFALRKIKENSCKDVLYNAEYIFNITRVVSARIR